MASRQQLTPSASQGDGTVMDAASRQVVAKQLVAWCKDMVARLRELAARLEDLAPADACDILTRLQPHVDRSLAESDRILEAIDAET